MYNAKAPFGGPAQIIEYLGRYTHKVAITAHRILHIDNGTISFKYKDYADGNKQKIMTLSHAEFLRRFEQHILPKGFVKIRYAGYLHARDKMQRNRSRVQTIKIACTHAKSTHTGCFATVVTNRQRHYPVPCMQKRKDGIGCNIYLSSWLPGRCGAVAQPGISKNKKQKSYP